MSRALLGKTGVFSGFWGGGFWEDPFLGFWGPTQNPPPKTLAVAHSAFLGVFEGP